MSETPQTAEKDPKGIARFRKKPVEILALQWRGMNHSQVQDFLGDDYVGLSSKHNPRGGSKVMIQTLEGTIYADVGDWIIRGVQGEHYPCKPDIFEATYEPTIPVAKAVG